MKNRIKLLFATCILGLSFSFATSAAAYDCLTVSNDQYDGYRQVTFYNSCSGSWTIWTIFDDGGWSVSKSDGTFK